MEIIFSTKNATITERFREYAAEKLVRVSKLADKAEQLELKLSKQNNKHGASRGVKVELTLIAPGPIIRAEAETEDKFSSLDIAIDKLIERLRRAADRKKISRGGSKRPIKLHDASAVGFTGVLDVVPAAADNFRKDSADSAQTDDDNKVADWSPVVIREKVFPSTVMAAADAVDHMELVGHDFFLYIDEATNRPSVVYRRKGWNYGVISLES